jgi:hypothetical protein
MKAETRFPTFGVTGITVETLLISLGIRVGVFSIGTSEVISKGADDHAGAGKSMNFVAVGEA